MSVVIKKTGYRGKFKATATIEIEEPLDPIARVFLPGDSVTDEQFEYLLWYWGFTKGEKPSNHMCKGAISMKDAKVTIERVEVKGQYKVRVTIEILNPIPKTAKFFQQVNPNQVVLDGTHNTITNLFDSEEEGRQWADNILLAVMRKSWEEIEKGGSISNIPEEIDIEFCHCHHDYYTPSLLQEKDDSSLIPGCEIYGKCDTKSPMCQKCRFRDRCLIEWEKSQEEKKPLRCFSEHSSQCAACISCDLSSDCEDQSKKEMPKCLGYYCYCGQNKCKYSHTCMRETKQREEEEKKKPKCFGRYGVNGKPCKYIKSCSFISLCDTAPKCLGDYPNHIGFNDCPDCPGIYFNLCQKRTNLIKEEKPDCFGEHSSHAPACVSNCNFSILCHAETKKKKKPPCFGSYEASSEGCSLCSERSEYHETCKEETNIESSSSDPTSDPNPLPPTPPCIGFYHELSLYCANCSHLNSCLSEKKNPTNPQEVDERPKCLGHYHSASGTCQFCSWKSKCHSIFDGIKRGRS